MRLLVSALLAASVSFAAFAPAQACISACGGGGGGPSTSSTSTSTSTDTSYSPSESDDSSNHGLPGHGQSTAIAVFLEVQSRPLLNVNDPSVTLEQAKAALNNESNGLTDFINAIASGFAEDDELLYDGLYWRFGRARTLQNAIIARWGEEALYGASGGA